MASFFDKPAGKAVAGIVVAVGVGAAAYMIYTSMGGTPGAGLAHQAYVDAKTGQPYEHTLVAGEVPPVASPSGKAGYPPELCFWTADGKSKEKPTFVLLNDWTGKPGPTFCPDCHRLVVHHNPTPGPGGKVPPTEAEYQAKHGSGDGDR